MTLGRRAKILTFIIIVITLLALSLFIYFHVRTLDSKFEVLKDAKSACEGKFEGAVCEFVYLDEITSGVCEKIGKNDLGCKVPKVEDPLKTMIFDRG